MLCSVSKCVYSRVVCEVIVIVSVVMFEGAGLVLFDGLSSMILL